MCVPVCKPSVVCSSSILLINHKCTWYSALLATALYLLNGISLVGPFSALRKGHGFGEMHALFFDAGSTGTRLHLFTFYNHSDGKLELRREDYFHTQPGLSSFANNPHKVKSSIEYLLKEAQNIVPPEQWKHTPVALKATAGLRLISQKKADSILQEVRDALEDAELNVNDHEVVSIMDGEDEGYFAWYTVNFLLGLVSDAANSVAVLDLGGGSTQITFQPNDAATIALSPKSHITTKNVLGKPETLYIHSYLGLGLMSARLGILQSTSNLTGAENILSTPCFYPNTSRTWNLHGHDYFVQSMDSGSYGYGACYEQAKAFVRGKVFSPKELKYRKVYALSYYYDRAADAGIIDRETGEETILIRDFQTASKDVCSKYNEDKKFLCLDLTYITSYLHEGLGLALDKDITLAKKIESVEASWVLGAAFSHLR